LTAKVVEAVISYNFIEPGFKLSPGGIAWSCFIYFQENILGQIFYFVVIARVAIDNTCYDPLVPLNELLEGSFIPRADSSHQFVIWIRMIPVFVVVYHYAVGL